MCGETNTGHLVTSAVGTVGTSIQRNGQMSMRMFRVKGDTELLVNGASCSFLCLFVCNPIDTLSRLISPHGQLLICQTVVTIHTAMFDIQQLYVLPHTAVFMSFVWI
jgi:hypothetical protein